MARTKAQAEPLPLVPATWITGGSLSCGLSRAESSRRMRSSARSIFLGCNDSRRLSTASLRVVSESIRPPSLRGYGDAAIAAAPASISGRHGKHLAARPGLLHQQMQHSRQSGTHLFAMSDHVQHAMLQQIFGAL